MNDKQKLSLSILHRQYVSLEGQLNLIRFQMESLCGGILKENNCSPDEYVNVDSLTIEKRPVPENKAS